MFKFQSSIHQKSDFRVSFLGIGAGKGGTTWAANNLRKHPDIFLPEEKGVRYFNRYRGGSSGQINPKYHKSVDWYHSVFREAKENQVCGEITNLYLHNENSPADIYTYNPQIKLFVMLRDPVKRAFSNYLHALEQGRKMEHPFGLGKASTPGYIDRGLYYRYLKKYFDIFPRENIKVLFLEDIIVDARAVFGDLLEFLGLPLFFPETLGKKSNKTREVRFKMLNKWSNSAISFSREHPSLSFFNAIRLKCRKVPAVTRILDVATKPMRNYPAMDKSIESSLREFYLKDIEALEILLQKDLSHWKSKP